VHKRQFLDIAAAIRRASTCEIGKTAMDHAFAELVDEMAKILAAEPKFDRAQFINWCAQATKTVTQSNE
jgi:hypothetical protein